MDKINTEAALQESILLLERKQAEEGKFIKEDFHATYQRLKPANIVKNVFRKTAVSAVLKDNIMLKTVDVAVVLLANRFLRKRTDSFVKRTVGTVLVWGIKTIVTRNPEIVKKAGNGILKIISKIISRKRNKEYTYSSGI